MFVLAVAGCDDLFHLQHIDQPGDAPAGSADDAEAVYELETASDTTLLVRDSTGHGHDGACALMQCPALTPSLPGHGMAGRFDGGDLVRIPGFGTGPFTAAFWLRVDAADATMCPINRLYGPTDNNSWQLCVSVSGGAATLTFFTSEPPPYVSVGNVPFDVGSWHHVAIRWDGETNAIFVDRGRVASGAAVTRFDGGDIVLGADIDFAAPVAPFVGALDDLRIYTRPLTNEAIVALP